MHANDGRYTCNYPQCNAMFGYNKSLKHHIQITHTNDAKIKNKIKINEKQLKLINSMIFGNNNINIENNNNIENINSLND